jgi:carnitine O-acetyltransferase
VFHEQGTDLAGKDMIKFGIESKHSSTQTNTSAFRSELAQVLREMRVMCEEAAAQAIKEEAKL